MIWIQRIYYYFCVTCRPGRARTVTYAFSFVFVAVGALAAAALLYENSSYIRMVASDSTLLEGERFSVDVFVGAHVPVNAIDLAIEFPPGEVEIEGIDVGASVITIWAQDPYIDGNAVILQGGTFRRGFVGEHLVATINGKALTSGKVEIALRDAQLLAGDGTGSTVSISDVGETEVTMLVRNENGAIEGDVEVGIATDIDGDGQVSLSDVRVFMEAWFSRETVFDFNEDRRMNFIDFSIILSDSFFK